MLSIFIDRKNTLTFTYNGKSIVEYIPSNDQKKFITDLFDANKLMFKDEDGAEHKLPVIIHDNIKKITTKLNCEGIQYFDKYAGVPKGVRYIPNKMITYERDRQDWLITRVKRTFRNYDNETLTEQQFRTEMRKLLDN